MMKIKHLRFTVEGDESGLLIARDMGEKAKEIIFGKLSEFGSNTVLEMDFSSIKYMDASCANEVVVMVLRRLESGEYPGVFIVLSKIAEQPRSNLEFAMKAVKKAVVVREEAGWTILGELMDSYRTALDKVMQLGSATARELQKVMNYNTVNEASTKLSSLYQQSLVAREEASGKSFRYVSLLQIESGEEADKSAGK